LQHTPDFLAGYEGERPLYGVEKRAKGLKGRGMGREETGIYRLN